MLCVTGEVEDREGEEHPSEAWLGAVARGTMSTYMTNILQISSLSQQAASQLATDICENCSRQSLFSVVLCVCLCTAYLCNVLAALGQSPLKQLTQLETLVRAGKEA